MTANLYALFRSRFPADLAAVFLDDAREPPLSYGATEERTARLAAVLRSLGVTPGERVAVQVEKSPLAVLLYLACLRVGAVYLPLNTAYTPAEVGFFLADAEPRLLVAAPDSRPGLEDAVRAAQVAHVLTLDAEGGGSLAEALANAEPDPVLATVGADDLAAILYTSGTTGRSKGAMLSHGNLAANALTLHRIWGWRNDDVLLHALPIFHVHGLFVALHCALLAGAKVLFRRRFEAGDVLSLLPRATVLMGVPTFYVRLLGEAGLTPEACAAMRLFISGSAPLLEATFREFQERTGHTILERYGMTEAGMITSNPLDGERLAGTVGYALPDVALRVADAEGRELPRGETGVLEMKGPNLFQGYWRLPDKTAAEFRPDGFFITGDLATMAADGRVAIVGRAKDLIISGGYNVYPKEVEMALDALPGVQESAVIGVAHPDFGEVPVAVVVAEPGAGRSEDLSEAGLLAALAGGLARFKQPKRIFFVPELPRNTMGKVQKNDLRGRYAETFAPQRPAQG